MYIKTRAGSVAVKVEGNQVEVTLKGDIDVNDVHAVKQALAALPKDKSIRYNCANVEYFDGSIIGPLISHGKKLLEAGHQVGFLVKAYHARILRFYNIEPVMTIETAPVPA